MSQHNAKRRLKALERDLGAKIKARTAHLGCVSFIGTLETLKWIIDDIESLNPTDERGRPIVPTQDKQKLTDALGKGQLLIFSGIGRIQITDEESQ